MTRIVRGPEPALALTDAVTRAPGVGPARATMLRGEGVETVYDLLTILPRRYEDRARFSAVGDLREGARSLLLLTVVSARLIRTRRRDFTILEAYLRDATGTVKTIWFNRPYLAKSLAPERRLIVYGSPAEKGEALVLDNPEYELVEEGDDAEQSIHFGRIVPVYRRLSSLSGKGLRKLVWETLSTLGARAPEAGDSTDMTLLAHLRTLHFPAAEPDALAARRELARRELLTFQTGLAFLRRARAGGPTRPPLARIDRDRILAAAPFPPTRGQAEALGALFADMAATRPMARLLHGEVGSGKTMVALLSAIPAIEAGRQVALLAPTEVLAQQLHRAALETLAPAGIAERVAILSAALKGQERNRTLLAIARGGAGLVVGTHALFQEGVRFQALHYVIVDEQHRFGVFERGALMAKAPVVPDLLVMSATPIPRTLTLTMYGDLDVTRIAELPPGRAPVKTRALPWEERKLAFDALANAVDASEQGFVVAPLIEEERTPRGRKRSSVETLARSLAEKRPGWRIALLHGKMSPEEKGRVSGAFRAGEIQVLVATTVVEVGLDVPRATVMIVMGAESFGYGQLHQLRGRIGRSTLPGSCYLVLGRDAKAGAVERLRILEEVSDGFRLSEEDWRARGPGEIGGARQWGSGSFRVADLLVHGDIVEEARREAFLAAEEASEDEMARFLSRWQVQFGVARVA